MNFDKLIGLALHNDERIVSTVAKTSEGIPLINPNRNVAGVYPAIEFNQIGGNDVRYADNEIDLERHTFEVVYYCEHNEYMDAREYIKACMRRLGFAVIHEYTDRNLYTNLVHSSIHVRCFTDTALYERLLTEQQNLYDEKYSAIQTQTLPDGEYYDEKTKQDTVVKTIREEDLSSDDELLDD